MNDYQDWTKDQNDKDAAKEFWNDLSGDERDEEIERWVEYKAVVDDMQQMKDEVTALTQRIDKAYSYLGVLWTDGELDMLKDAKFYLEQAFADLYSLDESLSSRQRKS